MEQRKVAPAQQKGSGYLEGTIQEGKSPPKKTLVKKGFKNLSDSTIAFSKRLMALDWTVMIVMLLVFFICMIVNAVYTAVTVQQFISSGNGDYASSVQQLFDLSSYATVCTVFAGQLAAAEATYHAMAKSDHKLQYPARVLETLPKDKQEQTDINQLISNMTNIQ